MPTPNYDICIIGSGITGSLVADHFVTKGLKVVMLERGGSIYFPERASEHWTEAWQKVEAHPLLYRNYWPGAEKLFPDLVEIENERERFGFFYNMKYGIGGSGAVWSGMSWRLMPSDFQTRSQFHYGRDWSVQYNDLAPCYDRVEHLFHTSGPSNVPNWPWRNNYRYDAFKQSYLDKVAGERLSPYFDVVPNAHSMKNLPTMQGGCIGAKTCVRHCPQNAKFRPDFYILPRLLQKENFTMLVNTPCIAINVNKHGRIMSATTLQGEKRKDVHAKVFYLCANTVENIRLLLNSERENGSPIANKNGLLGHGFASHGGSQHAHYCARSGISRTR